MLRISAWLVLPLAAAQLARDYSSRETFDRTNNNNNNLTLQPQTGYLQYNQNNQNNYSQNYPNQNYPNQNYPNQNYPNQNYPNQNYPNQNYPNQNYPNQNYPNQNFPSYPQTDANNYPTFQEGYDERFPETHADRYDPNYGYGYEDAGAGYGVYGGGYGGYGGGYDEFERHRCPTQWVRFRESCYRFIRSPARPRNEARKICNAYQSDLLAINAVEEHGFVRNQLLLIDPQHRRWYTSLRQTSPGYWSNEADGSQLTNMDNAFLPDPQSPYLDNGPLRRDYAVYKFSDELRKWGLERVDGEESLLFVCEAPIAKLAYLIVDERTYTYGVDVDDPEKIPRGPRFVKQPVEQIYDESGEQIKEVTLSCSADGYPTPTYEWFSEESIRDRYVAVRIDPLSDSRYTVSGGSLIIQNPDKVRDRKQYHCKAANKYGTIVSESVLLSFGYTSEFTLTRSKEDGNENWGKVVLCDAPKHYPGLYYYWARDHFANTVYEDQRVFVSYDGGLYFSSLEKIDRGNYSCNVQNVALQSGKSGPFFPLFVNPHSTYQQLTFANNFPKIFPEAPVLGEKVRLECVAFGYPIPHYNWTRVNGNVPRHAVFTSYNRVMTLPNVTIEDVGEYVCTISNAKAALNSSVTLSVQAVPNFTIPLVDKIVDNKGEFTWTCEAFGIPDVNYTWWKNGDELTMETLQPEDRNRIYIQDNIMTIKYADPERDPGMYQCQAMNQKKATFSSAQLKVVSMKPSFKKHPLETEFYGAKGGNVTILCNPEAAPHPKFVWKKDHLVIGAGGKRKILENGNLIISPVSSDDAGLYTCTASNQYGVAESSGRLIVVQAPVIVNRLPSRIQTQVQQNLFLQCTAHSDELLDTAFIWYNNGMRIKEYDYLDTNSIYNDKRIIVDGGELSIFNVSLSDTGEYECVIISAVGKISSKTYLLVEGPPGPPGGLQVLNVKRNSLQLQWTDGASNGKPILGYLVSGKTNWNSTWANISGTIYGREFDRYNGRKEGVVETILSPWSLYELQIQAFNELGFSFPSPPSPQFSTPPDKPARPPDNIGGGGGKIGDLTISWDPLPSSEQNGPNIHYKIFWRRYQHDLEFQSLALKEHGNTRSAVVRVPYEFFYTKYEVRVQAINDVGEGPISNIAIVYSAEDMPQVAPQQVAAVSYNSTALNVTWQPIDQVRERIRGKLIGHRLKYWKLENKEEESVYYLSRNTRNWALIVGLQPDTYYHVKVMAFNAAGEGPESERFLERTFRKAPQKPPSAVHVSSPTPSSIRVTWRYVTVTQEEEPLNGFKVRIWEFDSDMSTANDTLIPTGVNLEAHIDGLSPGKRYNLRVLAYSNGGDGRMSSPTIAFQLGDYQLAANYRGGAASTNRQSFRATLLLGLIVFSYALFKLP